MTEIYAIGGFVLGAVTSYAIANAGTKRKLEELQEEYNTLVDRDPKTGRFVKSMRKLERE